MPKKCPAADHETLKKFNHDPFCTRCGEHVNPDALVSVDCKKEHKIHASRGLQHCPDCGESFTQA